MLWGSRKEELRKFGVVNQFTRKDLRNQRLKFNKKSEEWAQGINLFLSLNQR